MNSSFPSAAPSLYAPLPLAQNELARNDSPDSFAPPQLDRHPAKSNGEHAPMSASSKGKGKGRNDRSQSTKREKDDNSDDSSGTTNEKQIRKRNRLALSCVECKRRKIKCDRTMPCEACCKRNEQDSCRWEAPQKEVVVQPFALSTELAAIRQEFDDLKAQFAQLQSLFIASTNSPQVVASGSRNRIQDHRQASLPDADADDLPDSDTEDAALVLEELALGRKLTRVGARSRKPSSAVEISPLPIPLNPFNANPPMSQAASSLIVPLSEPRRKLVLADIWRTVPTSKPILDWLVMNYFVRCDWGWHLHHKPTFLREYEAFTQLCSLPGGRDQVDPLFLGILFSTLCLSVNSLESSIDLPLVSISTQDLDTWPERFFLAAQSALECGDWTGKPRIRTLQTIVLFSPYLLFAGSPSSGERNQTYLAAAIRIAQQLNLHKLGSDPSMMPPLDPALPENVCTLRREIPIRLLYNLLFLDYMAIRVKTSLPPHLVDCATPANLNDDDLSVDGIVESKLPDVATDISFELIKYKVGLLQRRFNEAAVVSEAKFEYDLVLDVDAGYREIIQALPETLSEHYNSSAETQIEQWRRCMITQTIMNRVLRLHRPFMTKFDVSARSALEAARSVLMAQRALNSAPLLKAGFQLLNLQSSIVVLCSNLWTNFHPQTLNEDSDYRLIQESTSFFEKCLVSRQLAVRNIASQSLQVMKLLTDALQTRKLGWEARMMRGGLDEEVEEETYARLLKRLGKIVVSTASMAAAPNALSLSMDPQLATGMTDWGAFATKSYETNFAPISAASPTVPSVRLADSDFDISSLAGPEYADASFQWSSWNAMEQFSSLSSF